MGELVSFVCEFDEFVVRGDTSVGVLQIASRKQVPRLPSKLRPAVPRKLAGGLHEEVRLLFRWTMLNLPKEVPGDIRTYLQGFVD
jgi:hypothetical protein